MHPNRMASSPSKRCRPGLRMAVGNAPWVHVAWVLTSGKRLNGNPLHSRAIHKLDRLVSGAAQAETRFAMAKLQQMWRVWD